MTERIMQVIETLKERDEITIILRNGEQIFGRYAGNDNDERIMLTPPNADAPLLGWNIEDVEDILCENFEPAGDIVKIEVTDVKTGRKGEMTLDASGEKGTLEIVFNPTISRDEKGLYVQIIGMFTGLLAKES